MTIVQELASFVHKASYFDLSKDAVQDLKVRILDSLACAYGAREAPVTRAVMKMIEEQGGNPICTLIGGGKGSVASAALYNGSLVRYLDFNDAFMAPRETCHPSDVLGGVLAAAEYGRGTGKDLLTALAVSYQIQCRMSEEAPVRAKGFDHTVQLAYASSAGIAKAMGLNEEETANAIAVSGAALNSLRVTRTGALSNWKGLAAPYVVSCSATTALLAKEGMSSPRGIRGQQGAHRSAYGALPD